MRAVSIGLSNPEESSAAMRAARDAGLLRLHRAAAPELVIEFAASSNVHLQLPSLGITLVGRI
jgi:hypothetical protein